MQIPLLPRSTSLFQCLKRQAEYVSGIWRGLTRAEQGKCLAFIDLVQSCLKLEEWEVIRLVSERYLRHQHPRPPGIWPQHQILLMFGLDNDPNMIKFSADLADSCQPDSCHAASELRGVCRTLAIHLPCPPEKKKRTKTPATFFCLFFFLIIPSYSNFTNSVNLYNTSESETYKKSAGNIKKKKQKTNIILSNINYSSTQNRNLVKFISVFF